MIEHNGIKLLYHHNGKDYRWIQMDIQQIKQMVVLIISFMEEKIQSFSIQIKLEL